MWDIVLKIWFFVVLVPFLMLEDGIAKLNKYLKGRGATYEVDLWDAALVGLIIVLIVLLASGFRW